jgi:hypothetical protein
MRRFRQLTRSKREKGGVTGDIVPCENTQVANVFRNPVMPILLNKEALQSLVRYLLGNIVEIRAGACLIKRCITHIRSEDLNSRRRGPISQVFHERYRNGINFLSARASRDPNPNRRLWRTTFTHTREDSLGQYLKGLWITKKAGHAN